MSDTTSKPEPAEPVVHDADVHEQAPAHDKTDADVGIDGVHGDGKAGE